MSIFIIETFLQIILETFVSKETWHDYTLDLLLELNQLLQSASLYKAFVIHNTKPNHKLNYKLKMKNWSFWINCSC
jgi:hypothetical protein